MLHELEPQVDLLDMTRRNLRRAVEGLTPEQMQVPLPHQTWSIKDVMAHLAGNENLLIDALQTIATGQGADEREFDNEAENRRQVARGRTLTVPQVWEELNASRARLLEFLDKLTPEQLKRRGTHPYQGMMTVREFMTVLYAHDETHTREIVEWARHLKSSKDHGQV